MPRPLLAAASLLALLAGCAGPPVTGVIEGEPVCADFPGPGGAMMEGGLRRPVRLQIVEGKTVLFKSVLKGRRSAGEPPPKTFVTDDNLTLTVEWAQCENVRAPRTVAAATHEAKGREVRETAYECGEAKVYKTDKLTIKKGDKASHNLTFAPPPDAICEASEAPPKAAEKPAPVVDAGAAPAAVDAGAAVPADAGAAGDAGAVVTDGGAAKPAK